MNVEIVSDHYHAAAIAAKAGAGFALHGSSRSATRKIARALARESDRGGAGGPHSPAAMDRWSCRCNPSRSPSG